MLRKTTPQFRKKGVIIMIRKLICAVIAISILSNIQSCDMRGGEKYRDDLSAEDIVDEIEDALPSLDGYREVDKDYVSRMNFGDGYEELINAAADWHIVISERSEANADTIGVFRIRESSGLGGALSAVETYLSAQKLRLGTSFANYVATEQPKIDNAKVKVCGNYILFTILERNRSDVAERTFEDMIKDR